jgi:hypothetical protein
MHACMYVLMYDMYIGMRICIHTYLFWDSAILAAGCSPAYACVHVCMYARLYDMCICMRICIHTYIHIHDKEVGIISLEMSS